MGRRRQLFPERRTAAGAIALALLAVLGAGCPSKKTPRQLIQETIAEAEVAAEEKDVSALRTLLSEKYAGAGELDRAGVVRLLQVHFLRAQDIHLLVRVPAIHVQGEDRAEATVLAAMASSPIAAPQQLAGLSAELMRFELQLALEDGKWKVLSATWSPASAGDFL